MPSSGKYLLDRLEEYDGGDAATGHSIIATPPPMVATATKPAFFDVASSYVNGLTRRLEERAARAPAAAKRAKKAASGSAQASEDGGMVNYLKSWF